MNKGKIIVFEGLDTSFKETNAKRLYEYLLEKGIKTNFYSFPVYDKESSYFVKEYLKGSYGKDPADVNYYAASMFYMIDQYHVWKTEMEENYNNGSIIVCDRFWTSNLYHQLSKTNYKEESYRYNRSRVEELTRLAVDKLGMPYPNLIFLMKNNFDNIVELLKQKNSSNDIHESKLDYLKNVWDYYIFKNDSNIPQSCRHDIWCTDYETGDDIFEKHNLRTPDEIFEDVKKKMVEIINKEKIEEIKNTVSQACENMKFDFNKEENENGEH